MTNQATELTKDEMSQVQGGAQVDFYLHVVGMEGEATSSTHGSGGGAGKVSMQDMHFVIG